MVVFKKTGVIIFHIHITSSDLYFPEECVVEDNVSISQYRKYGLPTLPLKELVLWL